jgi:hypothetical protein
MPNEFRRPNSGVTFPLSNRVIVLINAVQALAGVSVATNSLYWFGTKPLQQHLKGAIKQGTRAKRSAGHAHILFADYLPDKQLSGMAASARK